jgi:catechol 2,3-dioxygenase-like lactoylglutathione lyase family enzyme
MHKMFTLLVAGSLFCADALAQPVKAKLDHVVIAVQDLGAAKDLYSHLGFAMGRNGRHPTGTENSTAHFNGGGYLELLTPYDTTLAGGRSYAEYLKQGVVPGQPVWRSTRRSRQHAISPQLD